MWAERDTRRRMKRGDRRGRPRHSSQYQALAFSWQHLAGSWRKSPDVSVGANLSTFNSPSGVLAISRYFRRTVASTSDQSNERGIRGPGRQESLPRHAKTLRHVSRVSRTVIKT